jgi:hypothetical protein
MLAQQRIRPPALIGMTSYHNSAKGITVYGFLPCAGYPTSTYVLTEAECGFKRRILNRTTRHWHTRFAEGSP